MSSCILVSENDDTAAMINKRVVLVSNKYPFPADDGKKTVLAGFAAYFLAKYGKDNFTYIVIGQPEVKLNEKLSGNTVFITPPGRLAQLWSLVRLLFSGDSQSLQEALTWSAATNQKLQNLIAEISPDIVVLDTIRIGQYFNQCDVYPYRRILYMDDLFYVRFERLLQVADNQPDIELDPVGTFASHLPAIAKLLLRAKLVQKLLFRFEMSRVKYRETKSPEQFDRCLLINPNEARTLTDVTSASNIFSVKPLLPVPDTSLQRNYAGAPDFLIFGSLRHPVYRASVIRFLECSMETIQREMPAARIRIVGAGADDTIIKLAEKYSDNIMLEGFVDDLEALFASSCCLLVPMLVAGGLKLKALTALYYGMPMISTDAGIDGIEVQGGVDCIIENALERFPQQMQKLCDPHLNRDISHNARQTFLKYYSRDSVFTEYDGLFD